MNHPGGITRRGFLSRTAITGIGVGLTTQVNGQRAEPAPPAPAPGELPEPDLGEAAALRWLEGQDSSRVMGATCGVAWEMGRVQPGRPFACVTESGGKLACQSWPLAYWPDGSVKWSAHAIAPGSDRSKVLGIEPDATGPLPDNPLRATEHDGSIVVDTGTIRCVVLTTGSVLIQSIERDGRVILRDGGLVCLNQDRPSEPDGQGAAPAKVTRFESKIDSARLEQSGPIRAVVRIEARHSDGKRDWLPVTIRLYFYAGSDHIRMMHSMVFDGDEDKDFIHGLGVRFAVPMRDAAYDRHVRFTSAQGGLWAEAIQTVTGLRRDAGEAVCEAQVQGKKLPDPAGWGEGVGELMEYVPKWGDLTLSQLSADGFEIHKRTQPGCGWIFSDGGDRAAGVGYVGGVSGGVSFGLRNFWQSHPAQLDIRGAASDQASVTIWFWSPKAPAMDLRFYHDGLGIEGHDEELRAMRITYEDYEPGFGTPKGIARTSEAHLWINPTTPDHEELLAFSRDVMAPPTLACSPQQLVRAKVFGGLFSLPDRSSPAKAAIEKSLDFAFRSYADQQDQRRWYGFWNYGDVMHSYDRHRHVWRYDVGGFAWDNSELSPDLWLWYSYCRSGRAEVFRFAEAMCRHTGEVDVYHLGRFKGLGTRHNVMHWGCSAKQVRVSQAAYRRFYYYLTADERTGDLMADQTDNANAFLSLDPYRKIRKGNYTPDPWAVAVTVGLDWSGIAMALLTQWERTQDPKLREMLINSMTSIGEMPFGFFTIGTLYDPQTGRFVKWDNASEILHLSAVFGLMEVCAELIQQFDVPKFKQAWLQYCKYYGEARDVRAREIGVDAKAGQLPNGHSRLTAYAALKLDDPSLVDRAWAEFFQTDDEQFGNRRFSTAVRHVPAGVNSLNPVDETSWMSTNDAAQWSLAAIQNLALIGDKLPGNDPRVR